MHFHGIPDLQAGRSLTLAVPSLCILLREFIFTSSAAGANCPALKLHGSLSPRPDSGWHGEMEGAREETSLPVPPAKYPAKHELRAQPWSVGVGETVQLLDWVERFLLKLDGNAVCPWKLPFTGTFISSKACPWLPPRTGEGGW